MAPSQQSAPPVVQSCHELLAWLIPALDNFSRTWFALGKRLELACWKSSRCRDIWPTQRGQTGSLRELLFSERVFTRWFMQNLIPQRLRSVNRHNRADKRISNIELLSSLIGRATGVA